MEKIQAEIEKEEEVQRDNWIQNLIRQEKLRRRQGKVEGWREIQEKKLYTVVLLEREEWEQIKECQQREGMEEGPHRKFRVSKYSVEEKQDELTYPCVLLAVRGEEKKSWLWDLPDLKTLVQVKLHPFFGVGPE